MLGIILSLMNILSHLIFLPTPWNRYKNTCRAQVILKCTCKWKWRIGFEGYWKVDLILWGGCQQDSSHELLSYFWFGILSGKNYLPEYKIQEYEQITGVGGREKVQFRMCWTWNPRETWKKVKAKSLCFYRHTSYTSIPDTW